MAISPELQYPNKVAPSTPEYPYGEARNTTVPGDGTGTPWEAELVNDHWGFNQALLVAAGVIPSGVPDKVGASQYLEALGRRSSVTKSTVAEMKADLTLAEGQLVAVLDYAAGNNSGILFGKVVAAATGTDDGGSFIDLDNGLQWQQNFKKDGILINQFGAKPSTDSTAAIKAALNKGGMITGNSGTYIVSEVLRPIANTVIFGQRSLIFKLADSADLDIFDVSANSDIVFHGVTIDGNKANQTVDFNAVGVRGDGCSNVVINKCLIKDTALTGVNIRNADGTRILYNVLDGCGTQVTVNSGDAVFLAFNTDDLVQGNRVINPARIGIVIKGSSTVKSDGARVLGNYVNSSGENAISTEDGSINFIISDNVVHTTGTSTFSSTKSGIAYGEESDHGIIRNNIIVDAGSLGIELTNGANNAQIAGNLIINPVTTGIEASASDALGGINNLEILNNTVLGAGLDGVAIVSAPTDPLNSARTNKDIAIKGNTIDNAGRDAIVGSAMVDFDIDENRVNGSVGAGVRVINSVDGSIDGNKVRDAGSRGVYVQGALANCNNVAIKGNTLTACGTWGVFLTNSDNASVMNNTVKNRSGGSATTVGVRSEGAGNANLIVNNDTRGIATGISSAVTGAVDTITPNFT